MRVMTLPLLQLSSLEAIQAAEKLNENAYKSEIINIHTIKLLDENIF